VLAVGGRPQYAFVVLPTGRMARLGVPPWVKMTTPAPARAVPTRGVPARAVPARAVPTRGVPARGVPTRAVPSRARREMVIDISAGYAEAFGVTVLDVVAGLLPAAFWAVTVKV
jgi:hypothetical protein